MDVEELIKLLNEISDKSLPIYIRLHKDVLKVYEETSMTKEEIIEDLRNTNYYPSYDEDIEIDQWDGFKDDKYHIYQQVNIIGRE